jgi:ferredoxin
MYQQIVDYYRTKWEGDKCIGWAACAQHYRELVQQVEDYHHA